MEKRRKAANDAWSELSECERPTIGGDYHRVEDTI